MIDPSDAPLRGPFAGSAGHCGAAADDHDGVSGFRSCHRPVVYAGTKTFPYPRPTTWLSFACADHRDRLDDPHPLTEDEARELEWRAEQERRGRAGLPYDRPVPIRGDRRRYR